MQVYKLCDCGHLNIFDDSDAAPRRCEKCTRNILQKNTFPLSEYVPGEQQNETVASDEQEALFVLRNEEKDITIELPLKEDFIIGRSGVGSEYFSNTISRNHLYVTPRGGLGITIVDKESLNGTSVNGEPLEKNVEKLVLPGGLVTLDVNETGITFELVKLKER